MGELFIGPMSKNVVDAAIKSQLPLGLIPSRRQVDFNGGYVNNWTTAHFAQYVKSKTQLITLVRDHGGPLQGYQEDPGFDSFYTDTQHLDLIHIDPWKLPGSALELTVNFIKFCSQYNSDLKYEVGTEEAICPYQAQKLNELIIYLKNNLTSQQFSNIQYAVIQSGTSIQNGENTGQYSADRLKDMLRICQEYGLKSKEHNGDYLSAELIKEKFQLGLDAINIAPEFGQIETQTVLDLIQDRADLFELFYQLCLESGRWKKWTKDSNNKETIIKVSGHYVFSHPRFQVIKDVFPELDQLAQEKMIQRIKGILC